VNFPGTLMKTVSMLITMTRPQRKLMSRSSTKAKYFLSTKAFVRRI
jgi:hypothetical protein